MMNSLLHYLLVVYENLKCQNVKPRKFEATPLNFQVMMGVFFANKTEVI